MGVRFRTRSLRRLGVVLALILGMLVFTASQSVAAPATFSAKTLDFKNVRLGRSAQLTLKVTPTAGYVVTRVYNAFQPFAEALQSGCAAGGPTVCPVLVTFTPYEEGGAGATMQVDVCQKGNTTTGCTTYPITLVGTGLSPIAFTPTSINFGTVPVGATATHGVTIGLDTHWTVKGFRTATNRFGATKIAANCSLAGPGNCNFAARFSPTENGLVEQTLYVDVCMVTQQLCTEDGLPLTGTGGNAATFAPTSLAFGGVHLGKQGVLSVSIKSKGNYHVESITPGPGSGSAYQVLSVDGRCSLSGSIPESQACTFSAGFHPDRLGGIFGSFLVEMCPYTNVDCQTYPLLANGTGQLPGANGAASLSFPSTKVGLSTTAKASVTFDPGWYVAKTVIAEDSGESFDFSDDAGTVCPNTASPTATGCSFTAKFAPVHLGALKATMTTTLCPHNTVDPCVALPPVALSGTGLAPAKFNVSSLSFSSVPVYQTKTSPFTLTVDSGWYPSSFSNFDPAGLQFFVTEVSGCTPTKLTCSYTETFAPQFAQAFTESTYFQVCQYSGHICVTLPPLKLTGTGTLTSTTTTLTAPKTAITNQPLHLVAVVKPGPSKGPNPGTMTFYSGSTPISGCSGIAVYLHDDQSWGAECNTRFTAGSYSLSAVFSGTPGYKTSTSAKQTLTVKDLL